MEYPKALLRNVTIALCYVKDFFKTSNDLEMIFLWKKNYVHLYIIIQCNFFGHKFFNRFVNHRILGIFYKIKTQQGCNP